MKKSHAIGAAMIALVGAISVPCYAGFVNEGGTGELRIIGVVAQEEKAAGMGRNVPLREAIRQIVPSEYSLRIDAGANSLVEKRVTWKGGRPWTDILGEVVGNVSEIAIEVDVPGKLVVVTPSATSQVETAPQGVSGQNTWRIHSGDVLAEAFSAWGREAGWQAVYWEGPQLASEIDVAFTGRFEDAITQTIEALNRNGAQLRVVFYGGNKVVRIVESK